MNRLMQFFKYDHLPEHLQQPSKACAELAQKMDESLDESAEKTAGLRKLLEAKDCFVRAVLEKAVPVAAVILAALLCLVAPAWADSTQDDFAVVGFAAETAPRWNISSATDVAYSVHELQSDDPGEEVEREISFTLIEGINAQHLRIPIGGTGGIAFLEDERSKSPRVGLAGMFNVGTERIRWSIGGLFDPQNVQEKWRAITGISFSPEELLGG